MSDAGSRGDPCKGDHPQGYQAREPGARGKWLCSTDGFRHRQVHQVAEVEGEQI